MARRKAHTPEEIVAKLRQAEVLVAQGRTVAEAVRSIGVTEPTYYRWRTEFGGLKLDQVKRLKELEREKLLHSAAPGAAWACLGLRLCRGPHPGWAQVPHAMRGGRVQSRGVGDPRGAAALLGRDDRHLG